ncbi:MAG: pilus assembly protein TadE [Roseiflexus castenholzii]|nr:MAG: pilus assembly protein TadE [Roseiflexus castenholzii]
MGRTLSQPLVKIRQLLRDERGIELIEFLGFVPIAMLVILIAWQFIMVAYTGIVAAAVTLEDVGRAVIWASPGFDGRRQWRVSGGCPYYAGNAVTVQVQLETPHVVFPFIGALGYYPRVTAEASMRCEPPFDAP